MSEPNPTEWSVTVIVADAMDLEPTERQAFVDAACADDEGLRGEVESLLAAHDAGDEDFLAVPVARRYTDAEPTAENAGHPERIGRYRILELLGEGGMGTVYLAQQDEPVRRRVALKVIRRLRRPGIRDRFAAECQALARLKHPNIAAMYEAGALEEDAGDSAHKELRPYVAMEWIEGEPIHAWCDAHQLDVEARLRLFLGVCAGIRHAHGKGVLHCDLKPSNVLVTDIDGEGVAKVIDFGIARAIDEPFLEGLRDQSVKSSDLLVGSPLYFSPEAVTTGRRQLDVRSEVHSLGLLLYELLVGSLPFENDSNIWRVLQRQSENDPPAPSQRLSEFETERAEAVAQRRSLRPATLARRLQGDLDAVILKAVARDPEQRYASAGELASDLQRHLLHEPVTARPNTTAYVARRFVRRHLAMLVAASLLLLALLGGLVVRTVEARRAQEASRRAAAEAERARAATSEAEQVRDFLIQLFKGADAERPGGSLTIKEVLDRAAEDLRTSLQEQPLVRARLLQTIGTLYTQQGQLAEASDLVRQALDLRLAGLPEDHADVTESRSQLGVTLRRLGRFDEAEPLLVKTLEVREGQQSIDPELVAQSHTNLGNLYWRQERFAEAEAAHRAALQIRQDSGQPTDVAQTLANLGLMIQNQGRMAEARNQLRQSADLYLQELGPDHPRLAVALNNLGLAEKHLDSWADAEGHFRRAGELFESAYGPGHQWSVSARRNLINELVLRHRWTEALTEARNLVTMTEEMSNAPSRADALANLARVEWLAGMPREAMATQQRAEALILTELSSDNGRLRRLRTRTAWILADQGRANEALEVLSKVKALLTNLPPEHITRIRTEEAFAHVLRTAGRYSEAEARYRQVLTLREARRGDQRRWTAVACTRLGIVLTAQGRHDEAAATLERAIELYESALGPSYPELSDPLHELGRLELRRGDRQRSRELLEQAVELRRQHYPAGDADRLAAEDDLADLSS